MPAHRTRFTKASPQSLSLLLVASIATAAVCCAPCKQATQLFAQDQKKQSEIKPLEARTRLVAGFAAESVTQSVENLPNFDDTVSTTGLMQLTYDPLPEESYRYERIYFPRLNRVRKIISEASGQQQADVLGPLKDKLAEAAVGFEDAYQEQNRAIVNTKGGLHLSEPNECHRRQINGPAAAYILTELRCFDALPVMARVYEQEGRIPNSRLTLVYSMHLLAKEHPRERLSPEARKALDEYLEFAKELPPPIEKSLPAWNAALTETDFRATILRQDIGLDQQPQLVLRLYPKEVEQYESEDKSGWYRINERGKALYPPLRKFIKLAYPEG